MGVMRLYAKLLTMILLFGAMQHVAAPTCAWSRDAWFAFRCQAADMLGDEALSARLVDEYYNNNRRLDPELVRAMEIEKRLALPLDEDEVEQADELATACAATPT